MNIIVLYRKNFENMLTEEQKRKIEEKRTKALEKLKGKNQSQPFTSPVKNSSISIVNVSPSSRKRPILNLTQQQQSTECIEPGKISKTSFSPKFKKQKQNDQEDFNLVKNDQSSPSSKTLPKASYSPKFKNSVNNFYKHDKNKSDNVCSQPTFKRNMVKSFDEIPYSNKNNKETKQRIEENRLRALEKLKNKQNNSTCTSKKSEGSIHPTPPNASGISKTNSNLISPIREKISLPTSYSPTFKKSLTQQQQSSTECVAPGKISKTSFSRKLNKQKQIDQEEFKLVNDFYKHDDNKNDNVCSQPTFKKNIVKLFDQIPYSNKNNKKAKQKIEENRLRDSNEQKTSFSPSLKKKSSTDDPLLNEASTARQKIPAISFSPKFKKKPLTMISTTESNTTINLNATNSISISNELNSITNDILSHEFIDVIDTKRRAEENRKKALEKLKNKQTAFGKSSLQSDLQRSSQETESRFFELFFCPNKFFYNIDFQ